MAQNLVILSGDLRVLIVLTLAFLINELASAGAMAMSTIVGLMWVLLTSKETQLIVTSTVIKIENSIYPIVKLNIWQTMLKPAFYLALFLLITFIALP